MRANSLRQFAQSNWQVAAALLVGLVLGWWLAGGRYSIMKSGSWIVRVDRWNGEAKLVWPQLKEGETSTE